MVGTSGTVTTLAGIHKNLIRYVRRQIDGTHLDFADIERLSHEIAAMDPATRARNRCIGVDRADLIVAGCAILLAICRRWPVGHLRVGDRGLREGILLELTAARRAMVQAD
jgi:exopolyphosphatase/guanosine-5'-triphosphate,3'-diphosphate pyrophosphatase